MLRAFSGLPSAQAEFLWIFLTPILILLVKTAFKYVTKIAVFVQPAPDPVAKKAAHFDCLRTGVDLAIIGLVATAGALRLALKSAQLHNVPDTVTLGLDFIFLQIVFVAVVAVLSAVFWSAEKAFYRGVLIPLPLGCLSVYVGVRTFELLLQS